MRPAFGHSFNLMNIFNLSNQHGNWHSDKKVVLGSRGHVFPSLKDFRILTREQEWQHQLRSSLHPAMFAGVYFVVNRFLDFLSCFPQFKAMIFSVLPNLVQGFFAAVGDYYTWQLAEKIYGTGSNASYTVVRKPLC
jgi:hypothetical protein